MSENQGRQFEWKSIFSEWYALNNHIAPITSICFGENDELYLAQETMRIMQQDGEVTLHHWYPACRNVKIVKPLLDGGVLTVGDDAITIQRGGLQTAMIFEMARGETLTDATLLPDNTIVQAGAFGVRIGKYGDFFESLIYKIRADAVDAVRDNFVVKLGKEVRLYRSDGTYIKTLTGNVYGVSATQDVIVTASEKYLHAYDADGNDIGQARLPKGELIFTVVACNAYAVAYGLRGLYLAEGWHKERKARLTELGYTKFLSCIAINREGGTIAVGTAAGKVYIGKDVTPPTIEPPSPPKRSSKKTRTPKKATPPAAQPEAEQKPVADAGNAPAPADAAPPPDTAGAPSETAPAHVRSGQPKLRLVNESEKQSSSSDTIAINGAYALTCDRYHDLRLIELSNMRVHALIPYNGGSVNVMAPYKDGFLLGTSNHKIIEVAIATRRKRAKTATAGDSSDKTLRMKPKVEGIDGGVYAIATDGEDFLYGTNKGVVFRSDGSVFATAPAFNNEENGRQVFRIVFWRDEVLVLFHSGVVMRYDRATGAVKGKMNEGTQENNVAWGFAVRADGTSAISLTDATIRLFSNWTETRTIELPPGAEASLRLSAWVYDLAWSPSGKYLCAGRNKDVLVFDETGALVATWEARSGERSLWWRVAWDERGLFIGGDHLYHLQLEE